MLPAAAAALISCGKKDPGVSDLPSRSMPGLSSDTEAGGQTLEVWEPDTSVKGERDNTPNVLVPEVPDAPASSSLSGNDEVQLDFTHIQDGYFSARFPGESKRVKLQVTGPNSVVYTYDLIPGDEKFEVFPFTVGSGTYKIGVYSNIEETMYATVFCEEIDVQLEDEFAPFLYPNQYVWFEKDTDAISVSQDVCHAANNDLDAVANVYYYVTTHVVYDWNEAETVQSGYLPDVDEVLDTGKGICFDYSALMAAMLRSQNIPTRLEIGYAGTAYHAWISTYIKDIGWVDGIIQFDGENWSLMDPTLASQNGSDDFTEFIGDGSNYSDIYYY
ncbi:MAG: transglutaminase domain-containing protein [Lachnospiraceae bacterium]|nr:transglutaminase domain-containing protein [Lachnospiraceae bacterium]